MERDVIIAAALAMARTDTFDSDSFTEGMDVFLRSVNHCPTVTQAGRVSIERQMTGHLANRFTMQAYLRDHAALLVAPVKAPVVVLGMPRTGTTLMVNLLNQDGAARTLRKWEVNQPIPPAFAAALSTDPRCVALNAERRREVAEAKLQTNIHFEWYEEPTECVYLMAQDFKSKLWEAKLPLPEYTEFLLACDARPTYRWHKQALQMLQENNKGRWTVKAPGHALFPSAVLDVYPDARLVWMHRDPFSVVGSFASLIAGVHRRYQLEADLGWIRSHGPRQLAAHLDRMLAIEAAHPEQVFHVLYEDLLSDPIATTERLYCAMGLEFDDRTRAAMGARMAAHPRAKHGAHDYDLADFGIAPATVGRLFGTYIAQFEHLKARAA